MRFSCLETDADGDAGADAQQNPMHRTQPSSSSSTYTYFTEQAIRAGFASRNFCGGGQVGAGMIRECSDPREAIRRELEKERIREEIIAEENARRRILEAEVRRELMMEREMMAVTNGGGYSSSFIPLSLPPSHTNPFEPKMMHHQPIGLEERIAMSLEERYRRRDIRGFEMVPFQPFGDSPMVNATTTPVLEDNRKKVIVLGKPNPNNTVTQPGSKRKPSPTVTTGSTDLHSNGSMKRLKEEWSCAICQVTTTSDIGLNQHLEGKKHQAKEAALVAQKTGANYGLGVTPKKPVVKPVKLAITTVDLSSSENKPKPKSKTRKKLQEKSSQVNSNDSSQNEEHKRDKFKFWCEMCRVGAFSEKVMNTHKGGKRHLANLLELGQNGQTEVNTVNEEDTLRKEAVVEEENRHCEEKHDSLVCDSEL